MLTEVKLFKGDKNPCGQRLMSYCQSGIWYDEEGYLQVNKKINEYAEEHGLLIQNIQYINYEKEIFANVIFTVVPKEIWL